MKTFILDIISKITSYSKELDDKSLIINKKWILVDESDEKSSFIFRENNQLLISENGIIQKSSWDYITNDLVSLEIKNINYLFTPSFLDENLFILKLDGRNEYVVFINENKVQGIINSLQQINDFIDYKYIKNNTSEKSFKNENIVRPDFYLNTINTLDGIQLNIKTKLSIGYTIGDKVFINDKPAPTGKYKLGWLDYLYVKDGEISSL
ncbi:MULTISPECIES: hypothetical protein [Empedobacter]|uniref:hypothetical protein n=1 Tax=Empedobacter TaxID=59734 RepID=UPI002576B450|nr:MULTISPECIES: hypothetical protein [Empedobacter]MDM1041827.1 hypothetical protein [Empedobacter brevis]MDM1135757.1 hypothetical protein [Empedobacter sp. R750]MDM1138409.1 hypothetical protein [Empedobacter sp. R132-2]